jgi:hypothetical protein
MKQRILKIVSEIKDHLKQIDDDGISHPLLEDVYESLNLIEDEVYDDDARGTSFDMDDEDF